MTRKRAREVLFEELPDEILELIFKLLENQMDVLNFRGVNRRTCEVATKFVKITSPCKYLEIVLLNSFSPRLLGRVNKIEDGGVIYLPCDETTSVKDLNVTGRYETVDFANGKVKNCKKTTTLNLASVDLNLLNITELKYEQIGDYFMNRFRKYDTVTRLDTGALGCFVTMFRNLQSLTLRRVPNITEKYGCNLQELAIYFPTENTHHRSLDVARAILSFSRLPLTMRNLEINCVYLYEEDVEMISKCIPQLTTLKLKGVVSLPFHQNVTTCNFSVCSKLEHLTLSEVNVSSDHDLLVQDSVRFPSSLKELVYVTVNVNRTGVLRVVYPPRYLQLTMLSMEFPE